MFHPIAALRASIAHIRYSLELDTTLRDLEAKLHDSDDPDHIIRHVLEVACKFYGADWAGFLDVDMELGLWTPFMWYNSASEDKTTVLLSEYESMEQFDQWGDAMETGDALIIPDTEATKEKYPQEYKMYQRLQAHSVLAVPVKPRPVGFLALRNPTRCINESSMLHNLAFVVLAIGNEKRLLDEIKASWTPEDIQSENDVVIHFFQKLEIHCIRGVIDETEINSYMLCQILAFLTLHADRSVTSWELAEIVWPEEFADIANPGEKLKHLVFRLRHKYPVLQNITLIETTNGGYRLNPKLNITTDMEQFEKCVEAAHGTSSITAKLSLLEHAIEIYKGDVLPTMASSAWLVSTVSYYHLEYLKVMDELLETIANLHDYIRVHSYAAESLKAEPEHINFHYWLITASYLQGASTTARLEVTQAKKILPSDAYAELVDMLDVPRTLPYDLTRKIAL